MDLHEKANFTRLSRLLVDKGTEALRNAFDGIHSPANLSAVLSANKASLLKLKPRVINDLQWHLLYPPSSKPPDSKTFDVTLLTVLFRNICGLPKTGWGVMPTDSDRSMQANIVRIRLLRNEVYAHVTSTQVDNGTFEYLWRKISQVLVDLKISQKDIDELKTCPLGPGEEECLKKLHDWKLHEEETLIMLEGLSNNVKSMESSLNRLTQISEENRDVEINRSKEKDEDRLRKLAKHNFKSKIRRKVKFFLPGTREWLLKKVDKWFIENEHESSILLLTAGPGFGKTVFSARVCEVFKEERKLAGCHFCDFSDSNLRNPVVMLESLASQMCDNVLGFKEKLIDQLKRRHEVQNVRDAFRIYLQNPLDELELAEPVLIVIDGLDESATDNKNEIVNLIADYFQDLPEFIKVLVTSRPEISVARISSIPKINVEKSDADNDSDLKIYLKSHLPSIADREEDSGVFKRLVEMCEGSFLYAFVAQTELQKRDNIDQLTRDEIMKFLPKSLGSHYQSYFLRLEDELKDIHGDFDVFRVLEMLVAAAASLPLTFIAGALGLVSDCRETKNIINKVNEAVSCLLFVSDDDLVTVFHKSVVDWLLARGYKDHEYTVNAIDGHRSLWIMCEPIFEQIKEIVCSGLDLNITNNFDYALRHALRHLVSCEMIESYSWLVDVVIVHILCTKLEKDDVYLLGLWNDVLRVNTAITDELRARISWHILELDEIMNGHRLFVDPRQYLTSVLAHSAEKCFSENEKNIAKSLLSKSPGLVNINYNRKVEVIPLAVHRHTSVDIRAVGLSNDNSMAAVAQTDGTIILVDIPSLVELWRYDTYFESNSCSSCTFSPDDSFVLYGKIETALGIAKKTEVPFFPNNTETYVSCGFSPSGKRLVTSNGLSTIKLWDVVQQSLLSLLCTDIPVYSCFFNSTGLFIIANRNSETYNSTSIMVAETNAEDSFCVWNAVTRQRCDERNKKELFLGDVCKHCFPATFEFPAFKRLNVKPCEPLSSWKEQSETWCTGIFSGVECHFALDEHSLTVVESTHLKPVACWNFKVSFHVVLNSGRFRKMTTINDDLWLYADVMKLIVFRTLVATPKPSCLSSPARVYSSSFFRDGSRLATCTSDGFVNVWNVDTSKVDQRFKCNPENSPFACWWWNKFLFVFHVLNGIPTLSKYPMDANLELLPFKRVPVFHFWRLPSPTLLMEFSGGLLFFWCWKINTVLVLDVKRIKGLQVVTLPHIEPDMRITVSHCCSFVFGAVQNKFYIWKRNEVEAPVYKVYFKKSSAITDTLCSFVCGCCFSRDSKIAVVAYPPKPQDFLCQNFEVIDLETGSYKTIQCSCYSFCSKLFCFNRVVICATVDQIYILDMDTGALIDYNFQRYLTPKFLMEMKLSPNKSTLAIPLINGDIEFVRISIAQNPLLATMKNKAAIEWDKLKQELTSTE